MINQVCFPGLVFLGLMFVILLGTLLHYKPLKNIFRIKTEKTQPSSKIADDGNKDYLKHL